jgi:Holliday junction resolvase RusA-like endonuclease
VSELIIFTVPVAPVPQPRVKFSSRGGFVKAYTPTSIKNAKTGERKPHPIVAYKAAIKAYCSAAYQGPPLEGPIRVDLMFYFPRPRSMVWKKKPMPRVRVFCGGDDGDNLTKAVWDSLNKLAWNDDTQVCEWGGGKWIAAGDEQPRVDVVVTPLDDIESDDEPNELPLFDEGDA